VLFLKAFLFFNLYIHGVIQLAISNEQ